ncbi:MAG: hypothetical protein ACRDPG_00115, partial [Nocardioidaceae bacterium]
LYGVVGFERCGGGSGGFGTLAVGQDGKAQGPTVMLSENLPFADRDGNTITVSSHRRHDREDYDKTREWAPMNTYLATKHGRDMMAGWDRTSPLPPPPEVKWSPATILVDGSAIPFEICDLGDGYWAAIGQVTAATIILDSHGVAVNSVQLERVERRRVPAFPALSTKSDVIATGLDARFARVPFGRVRRSADYWALLAVERDHVDLLADRHDLSPQQRIALSAHWLARIERELEPYMERERFRHIDELRNSRIGSRLKWNFAFQLWFNTVGPGAKTWISNRYTPSRQRTFRLRWRP